MGKLLHPDSGAKLDKVEYEATAAHEIGGVADLDVVRSATKVVAPSDASVASQAMADYVCSGANDEAQMNLALAALASTGGTIEVLEGSLNIDAQIRTAGSGKRWPDNITIRGQGMATKFINRMSGGGGDVYVFDIQGENAGNPVLDIGLFDFQVYGQEHAANTKGQHGVLCQYLEHLRFDNIHFENLSEEGVVLGLGVLDVQGGKLSGKDLGSSLIDISAGTKYVNIACILGEETCQVEATGTVNINTNAAASPQYINIGQVICIHPGNAGVLINEAQFVNIDSIIVLGATTGVKTSQGVNIRDAGGDLPEDVNIGKVLLIDCGANSEDSSLRITSGRFINVDEVVIKGAAAVGVEVRDVLYSHIGSIIVHDNTDEGTNAHQAVILTADASDNNIDSIVVKDWTFGTGNGTGLTIQGDRNIIGKVQVYNADSWDIRIDSGGDDNYIGECVLSGHGTGGLSDGGARNRFGNILQGVNGANYIPLGNSGSIVRITKVIDHAALTDDGGATGRIDFDDSIPAGSIIKAVKLDFIEAWNSDNTTTLTLMVGYVGDLDAYNLTADPGENAFNHTTDVFWGESDCQAHRVTAAATPRVTFTEDNDIGDIIGGAGAAGGVTITITYMKA